MTQNKCFFLLLFICTSLFTSNKATAQDYSDDWIGYFSYLNIKDVSQGDTKVYVAADNAIFSYDKNTNEIITLSTIQGLSGETITNINYSEVNELLLIGYDNGLIQVYDEYNQTILSVVDIVEKPTIPQANKSINHFNIVDDNVYISTNYGISVYNLEALEFGDTYYIGTNSEQITVTQTAIFEGYVYAATGTGIKRGLLSNPNLIDYQEWEQIIGFSWSGVEAVEGKLFMARNNRRIYEYINNGFQEKSFYANSIKDLRAFDNQLIVTTESELNVYNSDDFSNVAHVVATADFDTKFTCGLIDASNSIYVGTTGNPAIGKSGFGILKTTINDVALFDEIHPDGPLLNDFFKIKIESGHIYATHGGYDVYFNPYTVSNSRSGVSHYFNDFWQNIEYDSILEIASNPRSLSNISIHPNNPNIAYISSSISGLLKLENNIPVQFYNGDNSTIQPFFTVNHFVHASTFDSEGSLWVMNSRSDYPLNRLKDDQWTSYSFLDLIDPGTNNQGFSSIIFDDNDNMFIGSHNYGVINYDINSSNFNHISEEEEGMPSTAVKTLTIDNNGQLWLGTDKGLRIVYNTDQFVNGEAEVDNIVVLDDGIARELLFQQYITDIEVDGSNNKWVATLDTGLYYFSSDGQETIFHFTKDNSPLPTNDILDVDIDDVNGVVYIATDKGMISYKSEASKPQVTLENAYVYPNPVRPNFNIISDKVKIRDLSENVNIKILDIEGNLVAEAETNTNSRFKGYNLEIDGGTALWNGKNLGGNIVASGVYLIMLNDLDTFETKVLKVMVVR